MRFVVVGAGAVGGVVGARLAQHGHDVSLVARGDHFEAIRTDGLRVLDPERETTLRLPATDDPSTLDIGSDDVVLLAVKGQDTEAALATLLTAAPPDVTVACLQNGVTNERRALRRFDHVLGVVVMLPAGFYEAGTVIAYSSPVTGILDVGRYPAGVDERAEALAHAWNTSGFVSEVRPDVMRWKYRKLVMNLTNAAEAACGPEARFGELASMALAEAEECFAAAGIDVATEDEDRERRRDVLQLEGVGDVAWKAGSSWQSLARRTGTIEADELNGEIVLLGRLHGVPTPANALLQRVAHRLARDRAEPGTLSEADLLSRL